MRLSKRLTPKYVTFLILLALAMFSTGCTDSGKPEKQAKRKPKDHLVEIIEVKQQPLAVSSVRNGTLRPMREVRIFNQEEGGVQKLPYYEGDVVKQGDVLVRMDDSLLRAELAKATANYSQALSDLTRLKKLRGKKLVAEEQIARASTALDVADADIKLLNARLGYTNVHAPFDGTVSQRLVEPGDVLPKYTHITSLIDVSALITEVPISELLLPSLHVGDAVSIRIDALGDQTFTGRISRIHPTLDRSTRRGIIEVQLSPVPEGARPGQLCRVTLSTREQVRRAIPFVALRRDNQSEYVYIVNDDNKVKRINVRSGIRLADRVEILEGLQDNHRVITRGFLGLRENKTVTIVNQDKSITQVAN